MKRQLKTLLKIFIIGLIALIPFLIWFQYDEVPLDYSALKIEIGVADPTINGYTLMREFALDYSVVDSDDEELAQQEDVANWDIDAVSSIIEQNTELLEAFSNAIKMDVFQFDLPARPETLIPEIGDIRDYFKFRIWEARLLGHNGDITAEFSMLNQLSEEVYKYAQLQGTLIHLIVAVALSESIENEYYRLLETKIPAEDCIHFAGSYLIPNVWTEATQDAYKQEFWLAAYSVEMAKEEPTAFVADIADVGAITKIRLLLSDFFFKINQTKNTFYAINQEVIRELPKVVKIRNLLLNDQLMDDVEDRSGTGSLSRNAIGKIFYKLLIPPTRKVIDKIDRQASHGDLLRLAYALKAYYAEKGALPEHLKQLTPHYIKSIPIDTYDGQPLRYSKQRGIVYSVGNDFVDNGGSTEPFTFTQKEDNDSKLIAEQDSTEPTIALRFLPKFTTKK